MVRHSYEAWKTFLYDQEITDDDLDLGVCAIVTPEEEKEVERLALTWPASYHRIVREFDGLPPRTLAIFDGQEVVMLLALEINRPGNLG